MSSKTPESARNPAWADIVDGATEMLNLPTLLRAPCATRSYPIQAPSLPINTPEELLDEAWRDTERAIQEINVMVWSSLRSRDSS